MTLESDEEVREGTCRSCSKDILYRVVIQGGEPNCIAQHKEPNLNCTNPFPMGEAEKDLWANKLFPTQTIDLGILLAVPPTELSTTYSDLVGEKITEVMEGLGFILAGEPTWEQIMSYQLPAGRTKPFEYPPGTIFISVRIPVHDAKAYFK